MHHDTARIVMPAFRLALWPAAQLGIPARQHVRARLPTDPFVGYLWQSLLNHCPGAEIDDLITLAQELLPLSDLAAGAASSHGTGHHPAGRVLDLIVTRLAAYPGRGWILIRTALRNPVIRCRNMAIRTRDAMEHLLGRWNA